MLKKQYKRIQLADSSPEWNISECSSSDEERWASGRQHAPESPLHIENCSSDEENDTLFNRFLQNKNASSSLFGQRKTPHTVRKKLPLSVAKRKRKHVAADERPNVRRILTNRNSDLEESPRKSSNHPISSWTPIPVNGSSSAALSPNKCVTPWRKVRKVFAPLRTPTSSILEATQCNDNDAKETQTAADLNETRIVWSSSSSSSSEAGSPTRRAKSQSNIPVNTQEATQCNDNDAKETQTAADLNETRIVWSSSSSSSSEAGSPTRRAKSQSNTPVNTQKSAAPTELELLVALIERECNSTKQAANGQLKQKQHSRFKCCRKDGYAAQLQRALASAHADQMFLAHDQQLGLQHGALLRVLRLDEAFGVHFATVQLEGVAAEPEPEDADRFRIVVAADMARRLQIGSQVMAFFDVNAEPYEVQGERVYVQPHKLWRCK